MNARNPLLIGQIAMDLKLITRRQLDDCLMMQAGQVRHRTIGALLVENGFLDEAQLGRVIEEQRRRMREGVPYADAAMEAMAFGKLLVKHGYTAPERVHEALRAQQDFLERRQRKRLGELLFEAGHLTIEDARAVLAIQGKVQKACTFCGRHYNVLKDISDQYQCRSCHMPLGDTVGTLSADETAYLLPAVPFDVEAPRPAASAGVPAARSVPAASGASPAMSARPRSRARQIVSTLILIALLILLFVLLGPSKTG